MTVYGVLYYLVFVCGCLWEMVDFCFPTPLVARFSLYHNVLLFIFVFEGNIQFSLNSSKRSFKVCSSILFNQSYILYIHLVPSVPLPHCPFSPQSPPNPAPTPVCSVILLVMFDNRNCLDRCKHHLQQWVFLQRETASSSCSLHYFFTFAVCM